MPENEKWEGLDEILEELAGGVETDWYRDSETGPDGVVSIEAAANREIHLKTRLDDQIESENVFPEDPELVTRRGLPPCKRVKKSL